RCASFILRQNGGAREARPRFNNGDDRQTSEGTSMNLRSVLRNAFAGAMALSFVASVYAAGEQAKAPTGAGYPKGHYAELEKLADWGGIWTIDFPGPGTKRETPTLKGKYLADYQAWKKDSDSRGGLAKKTVSNCTPPGIPYLMSVAQYPIEFLFTPGRV